MKKTDEIDFVYFNKKYFCKDFCIAYISLEYEVKHTKEELNELFLDVIKHHIHEIFGEHVELSDTEYLELVREEEIPKPLTFPRYNNEQPFCIKVNGTVKKSPKIICIRYDGEWTYKFEFVYGHNSNFFPEKMLYKEDV